MTYFFSACQNELIMHHSVITNACRFVILHTGKNSPDFNTLWRLGEIWILCFPPQALKTHVPLYIQIIVWCLLQSNSTYVALMFQFSWLLQMHAPAFLIFSPYGATPPWDHSSILMNSWPKSRAFKFSFCALKCCLILGFTKLVWSMQVATIFSWKAVRFWLSPSLHVCETSDGWTSPAPRPDSLIMNCS